MTEIVFELGRFLSMTGIVLFIGWVGVSRRLLGHWAWRLSFVGFSLLLFGTSIDVIDDYAFTREFVDWPDTPFNIFLEKGVGYLGGFALIFLGMLRWLPYADTLNRDKLVAETANRTKKQFLANMSHELRTPLNAVIGFSEIIKTQTFGPVGNPHYAEYAHDIYDAGNHLLTIINDMLDLSKIEAGAMELKPSEFELAELLKSCAAMVQDLARAKNIALTITDLSDIPALHADKLRVRQIILNILANAIKFTEPGGAINIGTSIRANGSIDLCIRDTGVGMAEADFETALTPFGQIRGDENTAHPGTGLGLPLAKSMMEAHGGTLNLSSQLGQGTEIKLTFPSALCRMAA